MGNITIHKVSAKEMRAVVDLVKTVYDVNAVKVIKLLEKKINSENALILLAKLDGKPAGLIDCSIDTEKTLLGEKKSGRINVLFVTEENRKQGVASKLFESVSYWFSANGDVSICCDIGKEDESIKAFLEKAGFETGGYRFCKNAG